MAKRYYVCAVIEKVIDGETIRMSAAEDVLITEGIAGRISSAISDLPWCLVICASQGHGKFIADQRLDPLPDFPLDGRVSAINQGTRQAAIARLKARGVGNALVDSLFQNSDGYREVIRGLGREHQPNFDENNFDVLDVV